MCKPVPPCAAPASRRLCPSAPLAPLEPAIVAVVPSITLLLGRVYYDFATAARRSSSRAGAADRGSRCLPLDDPGGVAAQVEDLLVERRQLIEHAALAAQIVPDGVAAGRQHGRDRDARQIRDLRHAARVVRLKIEEIDLLERAVDRREFA